MTLQNVLGRREGKHTLIHRRRRTKRSAKARENYRCQKAEAEVLHTSRNKAGAEYSYKVVFIILLKAQILTSINSPILTPFVDVVNVMEARSLPILKTIINMNCSFRDKIFLSQP